jgi:hypothetical protein
MSDVSRVIVPLRVLLILLFLGLIVGELLSFPGEFSEMARKAPELGILPWVLLGVAEAGLASGQIVIVCTWRLLTLIRSDRIFREEAFVWVDVIVGTVGVAWLLLAGAAISLTSVIYFTPQTRDPGIPIMLFGMVLTGAVIVLTLVVMRTLLRKASTLRAELEEVI